VIVCSADIGGLDDHHKQYILILVLDLLRSKFLHMPLLQSIKKN